MVLLKKADKDALVLSALEAIKLYRYIPINDQFKKAGALSTTSETLTSDYFKTGYLYIIQTICCYELGTGIPQIKLGIQEGNTKFAYEIGTPANAEDSIEYIGQLIVREGAKIYADFEGCTAADAIYMNINGYRVKK